MGLRNRRPTFCRGGREGCLFISLAAEERDSSLGGRYFNAKRDPSSIHRDFLEKFDEPRAAEPPTVASNEAAGAVSPGISF